MICDMAETYHIYDYKAYKASYIATLARGLRDTSRVMSKSQNGLSNQTLLTARIVDELAIMIWQSTKDGAKGRHMPKSIVDELLKKSEPTKVCSFNTKEEYELAVKNIRERR